MEKKRRNNNKNEEEPNKNKIIQKQPEELNHLQRFVVINFELDDMKSKKQLKECYSFIHSFNRTI